MNVWWRWTTTDQPAACSMKPVTGANRRVPDGSLVTLIDVPPCVEAHFVSNVRFQRAFPHRLVFVNFTVLYCKKHRLHFANFTFFFLVFFFANTDFVKVIRGVCVLFLCFRCSHANIKKQNTEKMTHSSQERVWSLYGGLSGTSQRLDFHQSELLLHLECFLHFERS